ncbi:ribosome hibernation promoting factor HPF [Pokkaliibacter plantistimulans]|uniref:Ribosome hibernation promoting factor n=2 Tax=Pseudomonadota TaxID=1224 RepID=A0ABX5LZZ5_9GAMM|nr:MULTISPECIES: ribosome-associated translation inhibitor RaiA [Pokkaliibacter]MDH2431666.1 ribosome-associated translation inhibitor RaiA [Pokkaliibacter sp. MBI-7]PPC74771.1 ribosome-associated translation inhibitor RaiA [Pokkaliibacter plantistimulans]PXF31724.1 ribosome hibernation promoting factor HPF [Pokkaliibacter plantistimulans]
MQINITGHQLELTPALTDYVHSKLQKLERHFDNITNVQVTLSVEKTRQIAEANVHLAGGELFATHENGDMYAAIDGLVDKLDRQLLKHKEKQKERSHGVTVR